MFTKLLGVIVLAVFAAGCGVKAQTYVMTKERTDIATASGGNAGYIKGGAEYKSPDKKTRKIYILEVSKPLAEGDVKKITQETKTETQETVAVEVPHAKHHAAVAEERKIVIPPIEDEEAAPAQAAKSVLKSEGPSEAQTYTVLKDDTLQKISKKFYNSYGKWIKIYEANKEKIKNPNFVKPGTVLTIPAVE